VLTSDFDYELPKHLIAQHPADRRDQSRLLIVDRASGQIDHRRFGEIGDYLAKPDCLVVNETRVLPARLRGKKAETGGAVEALLVRERWDGGWEALVKPGRRVNPGDKIEFEGGMTAKVLEKTEGGGRLLQFSGDETVLELAHRIGEVPLPPYIHETLEDPERYQTVYARRERSVAAPTAGLHFTPELLEALDQKGIALAKVDLDVGLDTFRPVAEDKVEDHSIHRERFTVSKAAARLANQARERGGRIVAVGTTAVRSLESAAQDDPGAVGEAVVQEASGHTDLFITPGYRFRVVDAMVTNFHLPRSTPLIMVCAFAGRDLVLEAYRQAIERKYRFYSFGDAMLFV
jgi:S-adenosylmethionine:tRNA ribosyltransferase-isomerase